MKSDRVLTANDYYDGPRLGIAELNGVPHIYEAEFDYSTDEFGDTYFLSPVHPDLLALILEDWEIWLRWSAAFHAGEVTSGHPALPGERRRHEELKHSIGDRFRTDPANRLYCRAKFRVAEPGAPWQGLYVEWGLL